MYKNYSYSKGKICIGCNKLVVNWAIRCKKCAQIYRGKLRIGTKLPEKTKEKMRETSRLMVENGTHHALSKGKPSYSAIHLWLRGKFGRANKCEFCDVKGKNRYEYALKKGFLYERIRENFIMLCVKCHRDYDETNPYQLVRKNTL